jgi:hypothetical protein
MEGDDKVASSHDIGVTPPDGCARQGKICWHTARLHCKLERIELGSEGVLRYQHNRKHVVASYTQIGKSFVLPSMLGTVKDLLLIARVWEFTLRKSMTDSPFSMEKLICGPTSFLPKGHAVLSNFDTTYGFYLSTFVLHECRRFPGHGRGGTLPIFLSCRRCRHPMRTDGYY